MSFNTHSLELKIAEEINKISGSTSNIDLLKFSSALKQIKAGIVITVPTFANLPQITADITGLIYFTENTGTFYFADWNSNKWIELFGTTDQEIQKQFISSELWAWGSNQSGRLGDGTIIARNSPVTTAGGGTNWCQVGSGRVHGAAIKTDGTLWTWGGNACGELGTGTTISRSSPGTTAGGGTNWCQVSAGTQQGGAIKTDGTLWTWGCNVCGPLGNGTTINRSSPGTTAGGGTNWCQVSGGYLHITAVKQDGTLWTWGNNVCGPLGDGSTINRCSPVTTAGGGTDWCQVSSGNRITAGIKSNGTLWTWGNNSNGALGNGSTTIRSSPGTTVGGGTDWCQVSAGEYSHLSAIKANGTLWTWGNNFCGALGTGNTTNRSSPGTTAGGGTNWCQVSTGHRIASAIKTDGTLWTWGSNICGELGTGDSITRSSPGTTAGGGTDWCQVHAICQFASGIRSRIATITL